MSLEKNRAIVLKTYVPYKQKLILFDRELGKIVGIPNRSTLGPGSYIHYFLRAERSLYFMHTIDIFDMPLDLAKDDLLFVHHVLEMCYFFMSMGSPATTLFDIITLLYTAPDFLKCSTTKKLFLFQIFATLGLYPQGEKFRTPYFHRLATTSIDMVVLQPLDLMVEREIDEWLMECIALHPCTHNFKTIHFLRNNRIL